MGGSGRGPGSKMSHERYGMRRKRYIARQLSRAINSSIAPQGVDSRTPELEANIAQLSAENKQLLDSVVRQRAEFDNYRKRSQKEKDQIRDSSREDVLFKLLPVVDNFERALASSATTTDAASIREGVSMVSGQLMRILESEGLQKLDTVNAQFDPMHHEALATEERDDIADNHISEEMLAGYKYKDKVIRAAMVKVAKAPALKSETSTPQD